MIKNRPRMVDVSPKGLTERFAHALALVYLPAELAKLVKDHEIVGKKGPVFQTASLAGVMGGETHQRP